MISLDAIAYSGTLGTAPNIDCCGNITFGSTRKFGETVIYNFKLIN